MQLKPGGAVILKYPNPPPPPRVQGMPMLGDMENSIFTAQKAIDWLIYSFVT